MKQAAILKSRYQLASEALFGGRVTGSHDEIFQVTTDAGVIFTARKADGCLLRPEPGDVALLWDGGSEGCYILNVLVKSGTESRVDFTGDATIRIDAGTLRIQAPDLVMDGEKTASLCAPEITVTAVKGNASFYAFSFLAKVCTAKMEKASAVIRTLDATIDRITERVRNSFRWIENAEQVRAGRISYFIRERFSARAKHASLKADEDVTIDGKKIHLG